MAAVQEADCKAYLIFTGEYNAHHTEWLSSLTATDNCSDAALNFLIFGCEH